MNQTMEVNVKILCLGGPKFFWNTIKLQLLDDLSLVGIDTTFFTNTIESISTSDKLQKTIALIAPDIIILNGRDFSTQNHFENLRKALLHSAQNIPVFFITPKLKQTLSNLFTNFSPISCFTTATGLILDTPFKLINFKSEKQTNISVISPAPEINFQPKGASDLNFPTLISPKQSLTVQWKGESYTWKSFLKSVNASEKAEFKADKTHVFINNGHMFLLESISITEIDKLLCNEVLIAHVISQKDFNQKDSSYQFFLRKLVQFANYTILKKTFLSFDVKSTFSSNISVNISSRYLVLTEIFTSLLKKEGFKKITTTNDLSAPPDEIKLSFKAGYQKDDIQIYCSSSEFPLNQKLLRHFSNNFKKYSNLLQAPFHSQQVQQQFTRLNKKYVNLKKIYKQKLETEALDEKDQYLYFIASRKIDIIQNLVDKAYILDPNALKDFDFQINTALIFYDQRKHATFLNEKLKRVKDKKIFLNIAENLVSFKDLIAFETDFLEPFLSQGIVICAKSCKVLLDHSLKKLRYFLERNKKKNLSVTLRKLQHETSQCKNRLQECLFLKTYIELEKCFFLSRQNRFDTMEKLWKKGVSVRVEPTGIKKIAIFSNQHDSISHIQKSINRIFPASDILIKEIKYDLIDQHSGEDVIRFQSLYSDLEKRNQAMEKDLSLQNANNLSIFFNRIILNINNFEPELVIFHINNELMTSLIKILKNTPAINEIPIIAYIKPDFSTEAFKILLKYGVQPLLLPVDYTHTRPYITLLTQLFAPNLTDESLSTFS